MAGTGAGQLSASQVAQLSSAVVTAVSQAFSSVNGAQGQSERSECSLGRPDATRSLTGTSSNTRIDSVYRASLEAHVHLLGTGDRLS